MEQLELLVLPYSIEDFQKVFKERLPKDCNILDEYKQYLLQNVNSHHYGDYETMEKWYKSQSEAIEHKTCS